MPIIKVKDITSTKKSLKFPKKYMVYLLNDDYTTMDFVVDVLIDIFHKSQEEAQRIMLEVHNNGKGLCGTYTKDIAFTKVDEVQSIARANNFPLKAVAVSE